MSEPTIAELMAQVAELRSALEASAPKKVEADTTERTYHHRIPGSSIFIQKEDDNGAKYAVQLNFNHEGVLVTRDPDVNAFLKPLLNRFGSPIFDHTPVPDEMLAGAAEEVRKNAEKAIDRLAASKK